MRRALPPPGFNKKGQEDFSILGDVVGALTTLMHGHHGGRALLGCLCVSQGAEPCCSNEHPPKSQHQVSSSPTLLDHRGSVELPTASSSPQNPADGAIPSETPSFIVGEPRSGLSSTTTCPSPEGAHGTSAHNSVAGTSHVAPDNTRGQQGPSCLTGSRAQTRWFTGARLGCFRSTHDREEFRPSTNLVLKT